MTEKPTTSLSSDLRRAFSPKLLAAYALAAVVGYAGHLHHVPLTWVLGPLLTAAALAIAGADLRPSENVRRFGQAVVGAAVGLNLSGPVLAELLAWFPMMVVSTLVSVMCSAVVSVWLARMARIDHTTAYFASLPGGLAEMGNIGVAMGARPEPIAIVQTLRIAIVVLTVPPLLLVLGHADVFAPPGVADIPLLWVAVILTGSMVFAYVLGLLRLNNPFMIGAAVFTGVIAGSDLVSGRMPLPIFAASQLMIGFSVGCRFRRDMLAAMPRTTLWGSISILLIVALSVLYALVLAEIAGFHLFVAALATAPGGMAEMAATAQILHIAVPTVVGFQVTRGIMVNAFASHYLAFLTRIGFFPWLKRLAGIS